MSDFPFLGIQNYAKLYLTILQNYNMSETKLSR